MSNYNLADFELLNFDKYPRFLDKIEISRTAKDLYRILFNRWELSIKHRFIDENGEIYFYFRNAELMQRSGFKSLRTINNAKKELIEYGLLKVEYSTSGKDNRYYFTRIDAEFLAKKGLNAENSENVEKAEVEKNCQGGSKKLPGGVAKIARGGGKICTPYIIAKPIEKKEITKRPQTTQKKQAKKAEQKSEIKIPAFIDPKIWSSYVAYKAERKEKLTTQGLKAKFSQWAKWHEQGININECIITAMANEWQGVFKPKNLSKNDERTQGNTNIALKGQNRFLSGLNEREAIKAKNEQTAAEIRAEYGEILAKMEQNRQKQRNEKQNDIWGEIFND